MQVTETEPNEIYNRRILELAANPAPSNRLDAPDANATAYSKLCGSRISVDIKMDGQRVTAFGQDVKACALGQAAAAIVARHVLGATADELYRLRETMHAMLKHNGPPPSGKWSDLAILEPVRAFRARHASVLLVFDAVCKAMDMIKSGHPAAENSAGLVAP
ncbi:MAG: iron-sulfur cluster assembly scaffold protein [Hyphomicrobiales bacterium]